MNRRCLILDANSTCNNVDQGNAAHSSHSLYAAVPTLL
jgi:hypothetical protein